MSGPSLLSALLLSVAVSLALPVPPPAMDRAMIHQLLRDSRPATSSLTLASFPYTRQFTSSHPVNINQIYGLGRQLSSQQKHQLDIDVPVVRPKTPRKPFSFSSSVIPLEPVSKHPLLDDVVESMPPRVQEQEQEQAVGQESHSDGSGLTTFGPEYGVSYEQLFRDGLPNDRVSNQPVGEIQPVVEEQTQDAIVPTSQTHDDTVTDSDPEKEGFFNWMTISRKKMAPPVVEEVDSTRTTEEHKEEEEEWIHVSDIKDLHGVPGR